VISEIHDTRTRDLLVRAGLSPGHRFVEFGCGLGYVTRWAATQGAAVTGIDASEDQIAAAAGAHARSGGRSRGVPRRQRLRAAARSRQRRPVLLTLADVHLQRPVDAMRAIYERSKPGGVMVCEEADVSAIYTEPKSEAYEEMREIALAGGRAPRGRLRGWTLGTHVGARGLASSWCTWTPINPHYLTGDHKGSGTGRCATPASVS
jgi:predicted O-methyltransferase YrrM